MTIKHNGKTYKIPATPEYFSNKLGAYKSDAAEKFLRTKGLSSAYIKQRELRDKQMNKSKWFRK